MEQKHLPLSWTRRRLLGAMGAPAAAVVAGGGALANPPATSKAKKSSLPSLKDRIIPIPNDEYTARHEKAREFMALENLDAVLLAGGMSMYYFGGFRWGRSERVFAMVLPRRGDIAYVCPAFERQRAEEQIRFGKDLRVWQEDESPYKLLGAILKDRGAKRIGIEETTPYFVCAGLAREAPELTLAQADAVTAGCRMIKSPHELALMELAAEATGKAIRWTIGQLREGMTARDIGGLIDQAHIQQGARPDFALVGLGQYSAFPHGSTAAQKLREGDIVLTDVGCSIENYQSDITRTTVFGQPSDRQRRVWEVVKRAQTAALAAARAGVPAGAVDGAARRVVDEAGFGPGYTHFTHRVGHGIGLDGHEWPYLVHGSRFQMKANMTTSNEPGIYLYGEFGVRIEDSMVFTDDGARLLSASAQPSLDQV